MEQANNQTFTRNRKGGLMAGYSDYSQYTEDIHAGHSKALNITLWAIQVIAAMAFCLTGASKLAGAQSMVQLFAAVGYGQWFRYFTGALEIGGALLIIFPGTAFLGACVLALVMSGATIANVTMLHTSPALPLSLLALMVIIGIGRHKRKVHHHHHLTAHPAHPPHPVP